MDGIIRLSANCLDRPPGPAQGRAVRRTLLLARQLQKRKIMAKCTIVECKPQDLAVIRKSVPKDQLPALYGHAYLAVGNVLQQQKNKPVGAAIGYYHSWDGEVAEVEAGFPVDRPVTPTGEVVGSQPPIGRAATAVHTGPYDNLEQTWGELFKWIGEQKLTPRPGFWEVYLTDPGFESDSSKLQTQVFVPLAD